MYIVLPRASFVPILAIFASASFAAASYAQGLPNTNFGKFVHQPGDNQYEEKAQRERHSPPPAPRVFMPSGGGSVQSAQPRPAWVPTPAPRLPDTSVLPIVADEPIKPAGFPPLPDRLELPVAASAWARANSAPAAAQQGGGGGNNMRRLQGVHEHYAHYLPGACMKQPAQQEAPAAAPQGGGGSAPAYAAAPQPAASGGGAPPSSPTHGYYKCGTPNAPLGAADYYSVNTGNSGGQGAAVASREPRLNRRLDSIQRPEAPEPLVVNQTKTQEINSQDLSLPDDDYVNQNPRSRNTVGRQVGRGVRRAVRRTVYRTTNRMLYGGGGMLRFR